jgi:hypothetical protein
LHFTFADYCAIVNLLVSFILQGANNVPSFKAITGEGIRYKVRNTLRVQSILWPITDYIKNGKLAIHLIDGKVQINIEEARRVFGSEPKVKEEPKDTDLFPA